jgi:hypothetical protein
MAREHGEERALRDYLAAFDEALRGRHAGALRQAGA